MACRQKKNSKKSDDLNSLTDTDGEASASSDEPGIEVTRDDGNSDSYSPPSSSSSSSSTPRPHRPEQRDATQNHGRLGYADYPGCEDVWVAHPTLKPGDACPACAKQDTVGRLYRVEPGVLVRLEGQPLIGGERYQFDKLRCAVCGIVYHAPRPPGIHTHASGRICLPSVAAQLALARYAMGLPFHRIQAWQALHQIPMPDASAWDEVAKLADAVKPMYTLLQQLAAEGDTIYYDDTPNKILSRSVPTSSESTTNQAAFSSLLAPTSPAAATRQGVYTTAVIAQLEQHTVYVFMTSEHYAGEELEVLLGQRTSEQRLVTMCDASSMNLPRDVSDDLLARWVLTFCLVHGRRQFYELLPAFDLECDFVLQCIGQVYQAERHCQVNQLNATERLVYHQRHSGPVMQGLRVWLIGKYYYDGVEDNSGWGQASRYLLRHWDALTRFLHHPGVPIDNSWTERTIKVIIRHRRNSLFFKTSRGAEVGDILTSVIHTAVHSGVNPLDYLVHLAEHAQGVADDPALWLPWHVADRLTDTAKLAA